MKILFLTDNFPPEVNAPATRTMEHCKKWVNLGAEITVITCNPNFPQGKIYKGYKNKLYQTEEIEGIKVVRVWSYIVSNTGFLKRIIDHLSFAFMAFFVGLFQKNFDVIIATSPQFFTACSASALSFFKRRPWVFEVRDMWPEGIVILKKESLIFKFLEKIELFLYRHATHIVTVTKSFKDNICERGKIPAQKISVIYNGSNNQRFQNQLKNQHLIKTLGLEGKFIIGYAGTIGVAHNLDMLIEFFPKIQQQIPNVHFLFIGTGALAKKVQDRDRELQLSNTTFLPPVDKSKIADYLSIFDIGLVPLQHISQYLKVIPSKIFELAAMRKPILLGVRGESQNIIETYNGGISFVPDSEEDFIQKIHQFYNQRQQLDTYNSGLTKLSSDFDRGKLAEKMFYVIEQLISEQIKIKGKKDL